MPMNLSYDNLTNEQICAWVDSFIHNQRNRELLKRRWCDGICFEPLAEEFNLSVRQTKKIVYKEQERLFRHLRGVL